MVVFLEHEALRLLELYSILHANPSNVASNGVLLKQHAREQLTASLNQTFPREQPWTEHQVSVKFKNLRGEYADFKWLSAQPGFHPDGTGLSESWWQNAKQLRPKCHAFKGKLPWVIAAYMKQILGGGELNFMQQQIEKKPKDKTEVQQQQQEEEVEGEEAVALTTEVAFPLLHKRKRSDEFQGNKQLKTCQVQYNDHNDRTGNQAAGDYSYNWSLAKAVEQSSVAAAGMARGFQGLIFMFQEQTAKCQELEQRKLDTSSLILSEHRSVMLALARSLEQNTRATADMAKGYRDLVKAFIRKVDTTSHCELFGSVSANN